MIDTTQQWLHRDACFTNPGGDAQLRFPYALFGPGIGGDHAGLLLIGAGQVSDATRASTQYEFDNRLSPARGDCLNFSKQNRL